MTSEKIKMYHTEETCQWWQETLFPILSFKKTRHSYAKGLAIFMDCDGIWIENNKENIY